VNGAGESEGHPGQVAEGQHALTVLLLTLRELAPEASAMKLQASQTPACLNISG
jgi:hypothetical protein